MKPSDFYRALVLCVEALKINEIYGLVAPFFASAEQMKRQRIVEENKRELVELLFSAANGLVRVKEDHHADQLAGLLELEHVFNPHFISEVVSVWRGAGADSPGTIANNRHFQLLYDTTYYLRRFADAVSILVHHAERGREYRIVVIDVIDDEEHQIGAARLASILTSLREMYSALAEIHHFSESDPRIAFIESGSPIRVGIEGLDKAIESMERILGAGWRAARFPKHDRLRQDLKSVRDHAETVTAIDAAVKSGGLAEPDARRVTHILNAKLVELLGSGVVLADVPTTESYDVRAVISAVRNKALPPGDVEPQGDGQGPAAPPAA